MPNQRSFCVDWAAAARADLDAIISYIAAEDIGGAVSALEKIESKASRLKTMPLRGQIVPELALVGVRSYRQLVVSPWRIIYRVSGDTVHVLAVLDSRRNLEDLLLERFVR